MRHPDWLVAGNGADELLALIARAAYDPGDEVLIPHPAFEPYETEAMLSGAVVIPSPLKGYDTDLDDLWSAAPWGPSWSFSGFRRSSSPWRARSSSKWISSSVSSRRC